MATQSNSAQVQMEDMSKRASDMARESMDTINKVGTKAMDYCSKGSKEVMQMAQKTMQSQSEAFQKLMGCKTMSEFAETQSKVNQEQFDQMMSNFTKLSEMGIKAMTDCSQPLNDQVNKNMKQAQKAA